jgi:hypothetical protein
VHGLISYKNVFAMLDRTANSFILIQSIIFSDVIENDVSCHFFFLNNFL